MNDSLSLVQNPSLVPVEKPALVPISQPGLALVPVENHDAYDYTTLETMMQQCLFMSRQSTMQLTMSGDIRPSRSINLPACPLLVAFEWLGFICLSVYFELITSTTRLFI